MDAPIEPPVTVDDIVAAIDAIMADVVPVPTHLASLPPGSHSWRSFGESVETPVEKWNEDARRESIKSIARCHADYILKTGATAYHVAHVFMFREGTMIRVHASAFASIPGAPLAPMVTVEQFSAALDARITEMVARGEDLVYKITYSEEEHRVSMPAVAPTHTTTAISNGFEVGKRCEVLLEKWDEDALLSSVNVLVECVVLHILVFGGATYHVERVTLTTGHRQDRDWVDFAARVVVSKRATTAVDQ